jgi:hypothetical protein
VVRNADHHMSLFKIGECGCCGRNRTAVQVAVNYDYTPTYLNWDAWLSELRTVVIGMDWPADRTKRSYFVDLTGDASPPSPSAIADFGTPTDTEIGPSAAAVHAQYARSYIIFSNPLQFLVLKFREAFNPSVIVCRQDTDYFGSGAGLSQMSGTLITVEPIDVSGIYNTHTARDVTASEIYLPAEDHPEACDFDP